MIYRGNKARIAATMLLVLFLSFQGGRMLCYHTHIIGETIISHSHPFNNPDRQHSQTELESLAILSACQLGDESVIVDAPQSSWIETELSAPRCSAQVANGVTGDVQGRAPPQRHI